MSIVQQLYDLGEKLRSKSGDLTDDSMACMNAASYIGTIEAVNQGYANERGSAVIGLRVAAALERIATAQEQAAMYGWGHVRAENLGEDS